MILYLIFLLDIHFFICDFNSELSKPVINFYSFLIYKFKYFPFYFNISIYNIYAL